MVLLAMVAPQIQGHESINENFKIASKIVFSDSAKTVWEMTMEPGESFPYHTHKNDYLFYVIEGSTMEAFDIDGNATGIINANTGEVISFKIDGNKLVSDKISIPISHGVRNVGSTRFREILVEFHGGGDSDPKSCMQ